MRNFNKEIVGKVVSKNGKRYLQNWNNYGIKIDVGELLDDAKDGEEYSIIIIPGRMSPRTYSDMWMRGYE